MKIHTKSFGEIEVEEDKAIVFKEGLPGFEHLRNFGLIEEKDSLFNYLQSLEDGDICFVITDPNHFRKDYKPTIKESYFEKLGGGKDEEFFLAAIITLYDQIENSTVNLAGPLLIHVEKRLGIQIITEDSHYTTKHKLLDLLSERG